MSYKANQEKLSVTSTGKVQSATQADTATSATSATTATTATSSQSLTYSATINPGAGLVATQGSVTERTTGTLGSVDVSVETFGPISRQLIEISNNASCANVYGTTTLSNAGLLIGHAGYAVTTDTGSPNYIDAAFITPKTLNLTSNSSLYIGSEFLLTGGPSVRASAVYINARGGVTIEAGNVGNTASISLGSGLHYFVVAGGLRVSFSAVSPYAYKQGGGAWGTASDSRLKTNVRELGSALEKIDALHPVHFEFINSGENANPSGTRTGFIAQEFEQVLPGHTFEMEPMVDADKTLLGEGVKAKGIEADLVPYLVKAIQELKAELDTVKAELATLKV
jgi:hypothetical protein